MAKAGKTAVKSLDKAVTKAVGRGDEAAAMVRDRAKATYTKAALRRQGDFYAREQAIKKAVSKVKAKVGGVAKKAKKIGQTKIPGTGPAARLERAAKRVRKHKLPSGPGVNKDSWKKLPIKPRPGAKMTKAQRLESTQTATGATAARMPRSKGTDAQIAGKASYPYPTKKKSVLTRAKKQAPEFSSKKRKAKATTKAQEAGKKLAAKTKASRTPNLTRGGSAAKPKVKPRTKQGFLSKRPGKGEPAETVSVTTKLRRKRGQDGLLIKPRGDAYQKFEKLNRKEKK